MLLVLALGSDRGLAVDFGFVVVIAAVALLGVLVIVPGPAAFVTVAVAIVLQLFTVPIAGSALGGAAHRCGAPLDASTHHNELPDQE